jgi:hypothetical protein
MRFAQAAFFKRDAIQTSAFADLRARQSFIYLISILVSPKYGIEP